MKISLLCSDPDHPINFHLKLWMNRNKKNNDIELVQKKSELKGGELLFLISCSEIVSEIERSKYKASLVLHASDLPIGRGWSPHVWELLGGADTITLSLLEAEDKVDSGRIWKKLQIAIPKHSLWDEIDDLLFKAEIDLLDYAVDNLDLCEPTPQSANRQPTYYPRRTPKDSRLDVHKTIAEQFDLLRVCNPNRFPAYFEHLGNRYILKIEKLNEQ